ncbi:SdpA family antimicrobial peptide system protein [Nonomuraea sp. NN258]|uniref:SdpA family antimicrobial peptide system protein n=1 Tax=Nonomuraea antri TaxID=2730852 RepID=UPI00156A6BD6|nr:SdpA family antimicrobial peptide system protein [Nonomuraea antri]NRQ31657.1 SdpA family antimicrobial peptide system protein [Nonomuraea antri]
MSTDRGLGGTDRGLGGTVLLLGFAWATVIVYVVVSQLPATAVELPAQRSVGREIRVVAPQGWAFFTKSAREPREVLWRAVTGRWEPAMRAPHAEPRNALGLNRASRAEAVDLGLLTSAVPKERWSNCESGAVADCLAAYGTPVPVTNPAPEPLVCGEVGLSRQRPLPWAWSDAAARTGIPASVVRLEVAC